MVRHAQKLCQTASDLFRKVGYVSGILRGMSGFSEHSSLPYPRRTNAETSTLRIPKKWGFGFPEPFRALVSLCCASSCSLVVCGVLRSRLAIERVHQVDNNSQRWKQSDQEEYQWISPRRAGKVLSGDTAAHTVENHDRDDLEDVR